MSVHGTFNGRPPTAPRNPAARTNDSRPECTELTATTQTATLPLSSAGSWSLRRSSILGVLPCRTSCMLHTHFTVFDEELLLLFNFRRSSLLLHAVGATAQKGSGRRAQYHPVSRSDEGLLFSVYCNCKMQVPSNVITYQSHVKMAGQQHLRPFRRTASQCKMRSLTGVIRIFQSPSRIGMWFITKQAPLALRTRSALPSKPLRS